VNRSKITWSKCSVSEYVSGGAVGYVCGSDVY